MAFNSLTFVEYFLYTYLAYLILHKHHKLQNVVLLIGSLFIYSYVEWRFTLLIGLSTVVDFTATKWLSETENPKARKALVAYSAIINLGVLGLFKYYGFFVASFADLLRSFGMQPDFVVLNLVLPSGISFYTFQNLAYTIDVYRRKIGPERNFIDFALFVTFFPQLVAGPVDRAGDLLPQIKRPRVLRIEDIDAGLSLIVLGYVKKILMADNLAAVVEPVFSQPAAFAGFDYPLAAVCFGFQIYCDFSAYSDMARGLSRLMGFELALNFNLPYFARNIQEFWRRWHITMSFWFRDYVYIPLGGNERGLRRTTVNLLFTMLLAGFWHGANWTFLAWGLMHGMALVVFRIWSNSKDKPWHVKLPSLLSHFLTLFVVMAGWMFFRADSVKTALYMLGHTSLEFSRRTPEFLTVFLVCTLPLLIYQYFQYRKNDLEIIVRMPAMVRGGVYGLCLMVLYVFKTYAPAEFIYFNF